MEEAEAVAARGRRESRPPPPAIDVFTARGGRNVAHLIEHAPHQPPQCAAAAPETAPEHPRAALRLRLCPTPDPDPGTGRGDTETMESAAAWDGAIQMNMWNINEVEM